MIRSKDELIGQINNLGVTENVEALTALLEDVSDTIDNASTWETKYKENDKQWRDKYIKRFQGTKEQDNGNDNDDDNDNDNSTRITINDLFK